MSIYVTEEEPWAKLSEYLVRFSGPPWPRLGVPWRFDLSFKQQPTVIPEKLRNMIAALSEATRPSAGYRAPVRIQAARFDAGQKGPATRALYDDWMARYAEDEQYMGGSKKAKQGKKGYGKGSGKRYGKGLKGPSFQ